MNTDTLKYVMSKNNYIFSYFLKSFCNVLKLTLWPVIKHPDVL